MHGGRLPRSKLPKTAFKKGQSGNPKGGSKRYAELKGLRRMGHREVAEVGTLLLENKLGDLAALRDDTEASVLKVWMATLIVNSMQNSDHRTFQAVLDRVVGKPKEWQTVEMTGAHGGPIKTEGPKVSTAETIAEYHRLRKLADAVGDD